jgi:hypothetical protein
MARDGRRRRVLNEEVRTASLTISSYDPAATGSPEAAPRYGEQAHIENHPQITDYIPRRGQGVALLWGWGAATAVCAQALAASARPLAEAWDRAAVEELCLRAADGLTSWTMATMLLLGAALSRIIFNLRRHRVDDYRGSYRVWKWAALACVGLSIDAVAGVRDLAGSLLVQFASGSTTSGGAWGAGLLVAACGPIAVLATRDVREARGALAAAWGSWVAGAATLGLLLLGGQGAWQGWGEPLGRLLPLAVCTLGLTALAWYARYVVLDVQGLIEHPVGGGASRTAAPIETGDMHATLAEETTPHERTERTSAVAANAEASTESFEADEQEDEDEGAQTQRVPFAVRHEAEESAARSTAWIDGSEPEYDERDERSEGFGKSDRKRQRKHKERRHAA